MEKIAISVPEAAELLGLATSTMYTLTRQEGFPAVRVGHRTLIPVDRLKDWLEGQAGKEVEL